MSKQVLFEAMAWTRGPEEGRESEKGQNENLGWSGIKETGRRKRIKSVVFRQNAFSR